MTVGSRFIELPFVLQAFRFLAYKVTHILKLSDHGQTWKGGFALPESYVAQSQLVLSGNTPAPEVRTDRAAPANSRAEGREAAA